MVQQLVEERDVVVMKSWPADDLDCNTLYIHIYIYMYISLRNACVEELVFVSLFFAQGPARNSLAKVKCTMHMNSNGQVRCRGNLSDKE